ncbi:hypothetical protein ACTXGQ_02065 [Marinobacter sp. 1Y8]
MQNRRKPVAMRPIEFESTATAALIVTALLLGGCASSPKPLTPEPVRPVPERKPAPEPVPPGPSTPEHPPIDAPATSAPAPPYPPASCAWSQVRGVVSLLAREAGVGTWQFFPGDDILFYPAPDNARPGDEYRAILERPLNGDCKTPRLVLVAPVR